VPLADGYHVEAHIVVWEADNILKIPSSAIFRRAGSWSVFVIAGGRARRRTVEIGQRSTTEAQVLSGLSKDTEVVLHPSDQIEVGYA
jgi:HlyD family secretion protein